ncbi:MAG TPA: DUF3379 family protein [Steroidobacteraceae bacterium]|jgi:hypothetical protein|nr:DUF3379 family protein [Steroidobacteraceae bacterium]
MMDCTRYRQTVMARPRDSDPALREHRESCRDCNFFTEQLLRFESHLERALGVALPTAQGETAASRSGRVLPLRAKSPLTWERSLASRKGWLAMAASVVLGFVVAAGLWLGIPGSSLAADVVTHMRGEPQAWRRTEVPVPDAALQDVLRDSHLRLAGGAGVVSYANSCRFRGYQVPHLVIQTEAGPVTVMVLVHESVSKSMHFDEEGYRGIIVPVPGHGSLAVLTRGGATDPKTVASIADRVLDAIVWTG